MEKERLIKFMGWLRTVEINQSTKTNYSDAATYLKSSEKELLITEACKYITDVIDDNLSLRLLRDDLSDSNSKMVDKIASLELSLNKGLS